MTNQDILTALGVLPDDATVEDVMERLYLLYRIEKGLRQVDAGERKQNSNEQLASVGWTKDAFDDVDLIAIHRSRRFRSGACVRLGEG
jgi:hypothetical protein